MDNARGLEATVTGTKGQLALSLVGKANPPFEHIDHLELKVVCVRSGVRKFRYRFFYADDVSVVAPVGGLADTQVPVFKKFS